MENKEKDPRIITLRRELGDQIRMIRTSSDITLKELAAKIGVSESTLSKVENGVWVNIDMLFKISLELNFKIELIS